LTPSYLRYLPQPRAARLRYAPPIPFFVMPAQAGIQFFYEALSRADEGLTLELPPSKARLAYATHHLLKRLRLSVRSALRREPEGRGFGGDTPISALKAQKNCQNKTPPDFIPAGLRLTRQRTDEPAPTLPYLMAARCDLSTGSTW
jgi:hypothetical protein